MSSSPTILNDCITRLAVAFQIPSCLLVLPSYSGDSKAVFRISVPMVPRVLENTPRLCKPLSVTTFSGHPAQFAHACWSLFRHS